MKYILAIALFILISITPLKNVAQTNTGKIASLSGVRGISIRVEEPNRDLVNAGITGSGLLNGVKSRLREANIPVQVNDSEDFLYINVSTSKQPSNPNIYAFSVEVNFNQLALLKRDTSKVVSAETWRTGKFGVAETAQLPQITKFVDECVSEFIRLYHLMNTVETTASPSKPQVTTKNSTTATASQTQSPFVGRYVGGNLPPTITVNNSTHLVLSLTFGGIKYRVPARSSQIINTKDAGIYKYYASVRGFSPLEGQYMFERSHAYSWNFYIKTTRRSR
jgi:hypothetical protein